MFDYNALQNAPVRQHPSPHCIVPDFLPPEKLQKLLPLFPLIEEGGSFPAFAFRHPPLFQEMLLELQGETLERIITEKFNLPLIHPPKLLTLRGVTRQQDGKIHCDSASKAVTILLYLNDPAKKWPNRQGCLRFLERNDPALLSAPPQEESEIIPPQGGTLVVFPNTDHSWHGHLPYTGQRQSIQLNYMHSGWRTWFETKRHTLSAAWKKWHHV